MNLINRAIVSTIPLVPRSIVRKISERYIAGTTMADATKVIRELQQKKCCATLDMLGEYIHKKEEASEAVNEYMAALETIKSEDLDSNISIKLSQMGLGLDKEFCYKNIKQVVEKAQSLQNFVRIDMEDATYTTATLDIFKRLRKDFDNVGIVLQAYLRRTRADIRDLHAELDNLNTRLCKGIYIEKRTIAFRDPSIINNNYTSLLEELLSSGTYVGIATHDEKLVWQALEIIDKLGLEKDRYEFQMLLGVDEELRDIITDAGHKLRIYIPFGRHWYAYSVRRLKENPKIAGYVLQNLLRMNKP